MTTAVTANWEPKWRELAARLDAWNAVVNSALAHLELAPALKEKAHGALGVEGGALIDAIRQLHLPVTLRTEVDEMYRRLGAVVNVKEGERVANAQALVLGTLRIPLDRALRQSEGPRRRLVERAFVHLKRLLAVDSRVQAEWSDAMTTGGETRCEQLGGVHLLSHGIYAFKAHATTGRTDLILGDELAVTEEVRSTEAMVLTEWKLAASDSDAPAKFAEARRQAKIYAAEELGGFELRRHRYLIVVTTQQVDTPAAEVDGEVTYHYVNIAVEPRSPSVQSRQRTTPIAAP